MPEVERHSYDVLVLGAGGAGLRAAIEARQHGMRVAVVCKSLFGKAHTVMAEGGCAAAMGNVNGNDTWQVHFCDTLRGGKFLNDWRMVELHVKEAPERVWELESWGALFDRTPDGRISQRNFGGHIYPGVRRHLERLADAAGRQHDRRSLEQHEPAAVAPSSRTRPRSARHLHAAGRSPCIRRRQELSGHHGGG